MKRKSTRKLPFIEHPASDIFSLYLRLRDANYRRLSSGFFGMSFEPPVPKALKAIAATTYRLKTRHDVNPQGLHVFGSDEKALTSKPQWDDIYSLIYVVPLVDIPLYVSDKAQRIYRVIARWRLELGR